MLDAMDRRDLEMLELVRRELKPLRDEIQAIRKDIAPLLKWKSGLIALVGIVVTVGFIARAVEWIVQVFHK